MQRPSKEVSMKPRPRRIAKKKHYADEAKPEVRKPGRRTTRKPRSKADTRVVHLAMSRSAANILRTILAGSRHDQQELHDIHDEIVNQLKELEN